MGADLFRLTCLRGHKTARDWCAQKGKELLLPFELQKTLFAKRT